MHTPRWSSPDFLEASLNASGVPYDRLVVGGEGAARPDLAALLWAADGSGRYRGVVM